MAFLIRKLFPLLLVFVGIIMLAGSLPTVIGGAETQPTEIDIQNLADRGDTPKWLTIKGACFFMPEVLIDTEVNEKTKEEKIKAYYVPMVTSADAVVRLEAWSEDRLANTPEQLVIVRYSPKEYEARFPEPDNADELDIDDFYKAGEATGTVMKPSTQRLRDAIASDWQINVNTVTFINEGRKPIQAGSAIGLSAIGAILIVVGMGWLVIMIKNLMGRNEKEPDIG